MCERYLVDFAIAGITVENDALNGLLRNAFVQLK